MPNEKLKELPEVEQEEIKRILDLPNVLRFPTEANLAHLRKRIDCLTQDEIKQFKLGLVIAGIPVVVSAISPTEGGTTAVDSVISPKKPKKAKKSPKIAAKKATKAKKAAKKPIKKAKSKGKRK